MPSRIGQIVGAIALFMCIHGVATAQDTTPPEVISTTVEDGATGVSVRPGHIYVEFSEPVAHPSIFGNVYMTIGPDPSGPRVGVAFPDVGSKAVWFNPTNCGLEPNTAYSLHIATGVTDVAGNHLVAPVQIDFMTEDLSHDVTPPELDYTVPGNGEQVLPDGVVTISAHFSENTKVCDQTGEFFVTDGESADGPMLDGEINWRQGWVYFEIADYSNFDLDPCSTYTIHVRGIVDRAGNAMEVPFRSTFVTTDAQGTPCEVSNSDSSWGALKKRYQ